MVGGSALALKNRSSDSMACSEGWTVALLGAKLHVAEGTRGVI